MRTIPLQHFSQIPITNGLGLSGANDDRSWPRYVRTTDIASPTSLRDDTFASQPPDIAADALLARGDILMTAAGATVGKSTRFSGDYPACYAGFLARVRPKSETTGRFLTYWMQSTHYWDQVNSGAVRSTIDNFSAGKYRKLQVPAFGESFYASIIDHLDRETAQIDTLIAKQQQLIATLRERRRAAIRHLAVGQFDPLRPELGSSTFVGALYQVVLGKMLDSGKVMAEGSINLPYLRAANIQDSGLELTQVNVMPFSPSEVARLNLLQGDLLVVEGGAVGTSTRLAAEMPGVSFQKTVNRVRAYGPDSTAWFHYVLTAYRDAGIIEMICNGSTIAHFTAEKLRALRIPSIPSSRQIEIAERLDTEAAAIDKLISAAEQFIVLTKERRAALITAAVTGLFAVPAL